MLWLRGVKAFMDGGMLTGSAYMRAAVGRQQDLRDRRPDLSRRPVHRAGEAVSRSPGSRSRTACSSRPTRRATRAVDALLEAYERINRDDFPVRDRRPSITHANFMSAEAIAKMQALGVVANLQPAWLYLDGTTLRQHFGDDAARLLPAAIARLFEQGVTVGGGSDHMQKIGSLRSINPYNPFLGMWTTIVAAAARERGAAAPRAER